MLLVIIWVVLCILVGILAFRWGRSFVDYFLMSLLLSPLTGIVILLVRRRNPAELTARRGRYGKQKICGACGELIEIDAEVCRQCGHQQPESGQEARLKAAIGAWLLDLPDYMDLVLAAAIIALLIAGLLQL